MGRYTAKRSRPSLDERMYNNRGGLRRGELSYSAFHSRRTRSGSLEFRFRGWGYNADGFSIIEKLRERVDRTIIGYLDAGERREKRSLIRAPRMHVSMYLHTYGSYSHTSLYGKCSYVYRRMIRSLSRCLRGTFIHEIIPSR